MGCGKSYIGRKIAPAINFEYIDTDKAIEEQEQKSINQIFEQHGESYFRKLEHQLLQQLNPEKNIVISTGGGMPCFQQNIQLMNQKGLTIYLNRDKETILQRLKKGIDKRPILKGLSEEELASFYDKKIEERKTYYEQAKLFAYNADYPEIMDSIKKYLSQT